MGQSPFDHLLARHFFGKQDKAVGVSHIWHLLATGKIECDMNQPLNNQTVLWVSGNE